MKKIKLLSASLFILLSSIDYCKSQIAICDTMSINYVASGVHFQDSPFTPPDTVIVIPLINNTHTNFAYPQAKLINTTPFPAGMSYHNFQWQVFASAWNIGDTATAAIEFDVNQSIPPNYMVTFTLMVSNFLPLTYDSCVFANTVTVNLTPTTSSVNELNKINGFTVSPNPAANYIDVAFNNKTISEIEMVSVEVRLLNSYKMESKVKRIDISSLANGVYFIRSRNSANVKKLIVANN